MPDGAKARAVVKITTAAGDLTIRQEIRKLVVDDHDRMMDEARIKVDDSFGLASHGIASGQPVTVDIGWGDEFTKMFEGTVSEVRGAVGTDAAASPTVIVARDLSQVLAATDAVATAEDGEKLSDLVNRVASKAGLAVGTILCKPDPTFEAPNLPRSMGQNQLQFLQELAATWGCRCFVEVNDDVSKFNFVAISELWSAKPMGSLQMCRGWGEIREFTYERIAARAARQLVSASVDPRSGETVRGDSGPMLPVPGATGSVSPSLGSSEPGIAARSAVLAVAAAAPVPVNPPATVRSGSSNTSRVNSLVVNDPTQVSGLRGEVRAAGHLDIRAKGRVTLTGIAPWAEGDWWVKRVRHVIEQQRVRGKSPRLSATYECLMEVTR